MKKALFLLLFLSVGQIFFPCRAEIYSFVKGKIQRNDTSYVVTHHEWPDEKVKPYSDVATLSFKANSETYELKLQNYKGWEGEGGDFRVIKLYHKGNLILEFVDEEAWIGEKVRDRGGVTPFSEFSEEVGKHATYNEYCLIYPLENNATALLFEGYSWSSQVPLLTIIVIRDNKAEVVFNQPWSVEFFNAKPEGFELVLIANFLQWGEGPEYNIWGSDRHKLYTTPEGTMKFEKLSNEEEMCSLDFLTKGTWEFRFSTEEGPFNKDESSSLLYYFYLKDYADYFSESKEYEKAEQMLLECAQHIKTKAVYDAYLKLAYLYYDKEEYDKAMVYTDKILRSNDSYWLYCCYQLLSRIYHRQGRYDDAERYYELYHLSVQQRAIKELGNWEDVIPVKQKNALLMEETRVLSGWKLWLTIGVVTVVVISGVVYLLVRRRHIRYQLKKEQELSGASINLGQLKGAMTNQTHVVERLKKTMNDMKKEHRDEICRMKEGMKSLEADIKELKTKERENGTEKEVLKRQMTDLEKQLKRKTDNLVEIEEQRKIDLRINYFVMHGRDSIAVDMLLQLRYGEEIRAKYDIRASEYLPMLQGLLEDENPELHQSLAVCELNRGKLTMCYLMALGLDDIDMMARAACLAVSSVKRYRKECREVVVALQIKN